MSKNKPLLMVRKLSCNNKTYLADSRGFCSDVLKEQCTQTQVQSLFIDPDVFDLLWKTKGKV